MTGSVDRAVAGAGRKSVRRKVLVGAAALVMLAGGGASIAHGAADGPDGGGHTAHGAGSAGGSA
ncbi:superoxide dismutase family protein, partial [Streptomyces rubiginosohelvolus]